MYGGYRFARIDLFFPAPPSTISMAVGFKGGSYGFIAEHYKDILARHHVKLELRNAAGSAEHFELLQDQKSGVCAAMVQGGISDSEHAPGLLSLGRINYQIFCIFYRATEVLDDITELKGKRIAVGPAGAAARVVAEKVLRISGISSETRRCYLLQVRPPPMHSMMTKPMLRFSAFLRMRQFFKPCCEILVFGL
jgi:TRAP-type uncharacterized transport system substrate-binding protein